MDPLTPVMQQLAERALRAGWADRIVRTGDQVAITWNARGLANLRALGTLLAELEEAQEPTPPAQLLLLTQLALGTLEE